MADSRICSISSCGKPVKARGWCKNHYQRWRRDGDPNVIRATARGVPLEWLRQHVTYDDNECLLWPFGKNRKNGGTYGRIKYDGRSQFAHRVMCREAHGAPPTPKHQAAHSCGNNRCVNPRHLRWVTMSENEADKILHGTSNRGSRQGRSKLSEEDVKEIRSLHGKVPRREIAERFGIRPDNVNRIMNGMTWAWLK